MTSPSSSNDIQAIFDRIAPVYDQLNDALSLGQHWIWKRMTVTWAQPTPGDTALDLCCGSGDLAFLLAKDIGKTGKVIGADFSREQLAIAQKRQQAKSSQVPMAWVEADALNLPFDKNTFDCATMGYGLRNVTDFRRCLKELYRVLKPNGRAGILDFHRPYNQWMQQFQRWYLDHVVVPTAQRFGFKDDYAYIAPSLDQFPRGSEQIQLAKTMGFKNVKHYAIALEMMGVLVITKPA